MGGRRVSCDRLPLATFILACELCYSFFTPGSCASVKRVENCGQLYVTHDVIMYVIHGLCRDTSQELRS